MFTMRSLYAALQALVTGIAACVCALVFALNLFYFTTVSYDRHERVSIMPHLHVSLLLLLALAVIVLLYALARRRLKSPPLRGVYFILVCGYALAAAYLILNVDSILRGDANAIYKSALNIKNGVFDSLNYGNYFYRCPHQLGMLLYDYLALLIVDHPKFYFVLNLFFVLAANHALFKTAGTLFCSPAVSLLTLLCAYAFLPQFFFILFAYGLVPGFCMTLWTFYNGLQYSRHARGIHLAGMLICASLSVLFKMNSVIGLLALICFFILKMLRDRRLVIIAAALLLIPCMILPTRLVTAYYENHYDKNFDAGIPSILYLAMGTDPENTKRGPGWWDASHEEIYIASGNDSQAAAQAGMEKLKTNFETLSADPARACRFFRDKTISQWCEPTFQSIWSGPLTDCYQNTHTRILRSVYSGNKGEDVIALFSKTVVLAIWGFALLFLLRDRKTVFGWELYYIYTIGGFLFHFFWEGKSQYVYPYVFALIPFAMYALHRTAETLSRRPGRKGA